MAISRKNKKQSKLNWRRLYRLYIKETSAEKLLPERSTNYDHAKARLESYQIKNNLKKSSKRFHQNLYEIHRFALKVIFTKNKSETARRQEKSLKNFLNRLPSTLRNSLCNDIIPKCLLCQDLLLEAEKDYCINPNDDLSLYLFILKSEISLGGRCCLDLKEHMPFIVFNCY